MLRTRVEESKDANVDCATDVFPVPTGPVRRTGLPAERRLLTRNW